MTSREKQVPEGVRNASDFWLNDHTPHPAASNRRVHRSRVGLLAYPASVSLDAMVTGAAEATIRKWLESNTDKLLGRIAAEVARRVPPTDTKTGGANAGRGRPARQVRRPARRGHGGR